MTAIVIPTTDDLSILRERLAEQKRIAEYRQLKRDLAEITSKAVNTPNDLDGAMQMPDTDKVLQQKRSVNSVVEKMIDRLLTMCSVQPIIGNIIAILFPIFGMIFLPALNTWALKHGIHWFHYFSPYLLKFSMPVIGLIILKSSSRSLLLPILGMATSWFFCSTLQGHETVLQFNYNDFVILGVVSFIASLFSAIAIR